MPAETWFSSYGGALGITAAVVIVASLVNRYAPRKRRHIRRTAIAFLLYMLAFGAALVLPAAGAPGEGTARSLTELLGTITLINVAVLAALDLGLPALGVEVATLVTDLAVGGAYIVAIIAALRRAGMDLSGIVTTSAVVTGILALSFQATLGNILGGVALQVDNSIRIGDWIQLENGKQGRIREIRWRHTVLETRDWDTIIVPNAALLAAQIIILGKRAGAPAQHRMWVYFNVDFRYSPADVIEVVDQALQAAPIVGVAASPAPHCICMDFAKEGRDSFAYYAARYWLTDLARDDPTSSQVRARVYTALKRAGIPLALPAAQLFVDSDELARRERRLERERAARLHAIRSVQLLRPLHEPEIVTMAEKLRYAPFCAGEKITRQGAVAHWLYILTEGSAEVWMNEGGAERLLATISAPGFFGEMGLMTGEPRTATVTAKTDVECYRLDKEAFHAILRDRPEVAAEISALLAERRGRLQTLRDDLDAAAAETRRDADQQQLLDKIQAFFGLGDDEQGAVQNRNSI
jgi:small-conductance mechanosensitive channel/CRP-like cAMP-binding protein